MTPEEFATMQRRVDAIRNNGIEHYALFPWAQSELGAHGRSIVAEWRQAHNAKLEAEQKMRETEGRWREVYGGNKAGSDPDWYDTMSDAPHSKPTVSAERRTCTVKEPATPLKMVLEYEYEIEPAAV